MILIMRRIAAAIVVLLCLQQTMAQEKYYTNPILAGFYPDPSICRAGDDYYIVNSSFAYFPGLPLFHSKDLVNWKQIGHALNRPEQLNLAGAGVSRGLFAPAITYHNGVFYIVCTLIDKLGNFVITAKDPKGPWSNPVRIPEVGGIDPSLFIEDDGKAYIIYNSIPPNNVSLHNGHRTIRMYEFDIKELKVKGEEKLLINGGTDMAIKPVWIEAPHIFKKDGWYYLICAQGGTGFNHSEVVFRSRSMSEPFISYEKNPILTQKHLDPTRPYPVTTTGHADFVETKDGKWYAVFLGCRPYEGDYYNTGRETFMVPVTWKDGWPSILEGNETVKYKYPVPSPHLTKKVNNSFSGNVSYKDEFNGPSLDQRWIFLRTPTEKWYSLSEKKGYLSINLQSATAGGKTNPSFIAHRQQNLTCTATTSINFSPSTENEKAGLMIFQNEQHFYFLGVTFDYIPGGYSSYVHLYKSTKDSSKMDIVASQALPQGIKENIRLQIRADKDKYSFYYAYGAKPFQLLADNQPGKFLSTKDAGGFVGSVFALYATYMVTVNPTTEGYKGAGGFKALDSVFNPSDKKAYFNWFEYKGNDEVYR
jgi:xylan 1,4-beta-xylosidase